MGWGFSDWLGGNVGGFLDDLFDLDDVGITDRVVDRVSDEVEGAAWAEALKPGDLPSRFPYLGGPYLQASTGFQVQRTVEALPSPGNAASGLFFIGHATPGMAFDRLVMTQTGVPLEFGRQDTAGWSCRLLQRTPAGENLFISGFETGISAEGIVLREDLTLTVGEAGRARESYGGPIEPFLPMFLNLTTFGAISAFQDYDSIRIQMSAAFLQQPVQ